MASKAALIAAAMRKSAPPREPTANDAIYSNLSVAERHQPSCHATGMALVAVVAVLSMMFTFGQNRQRFVRWMNRL